MIVVKRVVIKKSDSGYEELDHLCFLSKNLYNATLYRIRQHFFETGEHLNYNNINRMFTHENQIDYRSLPAKVSKMTQMLVDKAFKSFFTKIKNGDKKARPPKYLPKDGRQVVNYTKQALNRPNDRCIKLSGTDITIQTGGREVQFVRLVPLGKHIAIEIGMKVKEKEHINNGRYASIDLGINNLATLTSNVAKPLIINGKPLKSINQYYNKKLAQEKSKLSKFGRWESNKTYRLHHKRNNKVNDYMHKSSRYIVNYLVSNNITTLIVGYNKGWKQNTNMSKVNNQKFVNIPFLKFINMLEYKCNLLGIRVIIQEESYTSKASFLDNEDIIKKNRYFGDRVQRGLFVTKQLIKINADVNASYNILKKYLSKNGVWNENLFLDCIEVYSTPIVVSM